MKIVSRSLYGLLAFACMAAPAFAGTAISLSVVGAPQPGKASIIQAHLTGTHIVYFGPPSVRSGAVKFYANGQAIGTVYPAAGNSTGVQCGPSGDPVLPTICIAPESTLAVSFTFPASNPSVASFYAHFDGDADYSGSSSPTLTVTAHRPSIGPIVNLILSD